MCQGRTRDPAGHRGRTDVDDFANALADHPLLDVTDSAAVTLAGYSGKHLDLQVPADLSKCEVYRPSNPGPSRRDRVTGGISESSTWMASASWSRARRTQEHRRSTARSSRQSWTRSGSSHDPHQSAGAVSEGRPPRRDVASKSHPRCLGSSSPSGSSPEALLRGYGSRPTSDGVVVPRIEHDDRRVGRATRSVLAVARIRGHGASPQRPVFGASRLRFARPYGELFPADPERRVGPHAQVRDPVRQLLLAAVSADPANIPAVAEREQRRVTWLARSTPES